MNSNVDLVDVIVFLLDPSNTLATDPFIHIETYALLFSCVRYLSILVDRIYFEVSIYSDGTIV